MYEGVVRQNSEAMDFTLEAKLGCYVYALLTPNGRVFYVGKGGRDGSGNSRVLTHFDEAEGFLRRGVQPESLKVQTILNVWQREEQVHWYIVRHGLDEPTAEHVEAALIDSLPLTLNGPLDNAVRGNHVHLGILNKDELAALNAPLVSPAIPYSRVFVFQIHNSVGGDLYEAIRGDWTVSPVSQAESTGVVAVGVDRGISQVVCRIHDWFERPPGSSKHAFNGDLVREHELLKKSFINVLAPARGFLQWGGGYTIVEFDGRGQFRCLRGSAEKNRWLAC